MHTTTELSENTRQGFEGIKAALCLASMEAKSNTASGLPVCLWQEGTGSRCSGKERDETGLDYFGARYFSGALGRFTSPDPDNAGASIDDPHSWNAYAYSRNNPLLYTDPTGRLYELAYDFPGYYTTFQLSDWGFSAYSKRLAEYFTFSGGIIYSTQYGYQVGTYKQIIDDRILALIQAGEIATPAAEATTAGLKLFGWIVIPEAMAIAEYASGEDDSELGLALAIIPGGKFARIKFTRNMFSKAVVIAEGNNISKVGELVAKFGGKAKDWKKMKTWDEAGNEIHYYYNKAVGRVGEKPAGALDPF